MTERLQRSRRRIREHRAAQREREKTVTAAVRDYLAAWHAIGVAEARRDRDIAALQQQITDVTIETAASIGTHEHAQAVAAAAIAAQGHSDDDIAGLLEIPVKRVRQLLSAARKTDPLPSATTPITPDTATTVAAEATDSASATEPRVRKLDSGKPSDVDNGDSSSPPVPERAEDQDS